MKYRDQWVPLPSEWAFVSTTMHMMFLKFGIDLLITCEASAHITSYLLTIKVHILMPITKVHSQVVLRNCRLIRSYSQGVFKETGI